MNDQVRINRIKEIFENASSAVIAVAVIHEEGQIDHNNFLNIARALSADVSRLVDKVYQERHLQ